MGEVVSQSMANRLRAIEKARDNIRHRIGQIQEQLAGLAAQHASDSISWINLERVSSFDEWVAKNKEKMSGPSKSIREALEEDIKELRRNMDSLKAEAARVSSSGRVRARQASNLFATDFSALQRSIRRDGQADEALIARLQRDSERAVNAWRNAVEKNPTGQNVLGMLEQIRDSELLGVDGAAVKKAMELIGVLAGKHATAAAEQYQRMPTTQNFNRYLQSARQAGLMGVAYNELPGLPPDAKRARASNSYTVKSGDTLSSIAKNCYGAENLWFHIWFANSQAVNNPDHLIPGAILTIP